MVEKEGKIGRKASGQYEEGNPDSVSLTMSSMLFVKAEECRESGFHQ
jgi:hypothetical protein